MMFDNSPPESPSTWDQVKAHLPLVLVVGGGFALFISMHTGAYAVATIATLHAAVGVGAMLVRSVIARRGASQ